MADTEQKYVVPNKDGSLGARDSSGKLDVVNEGGGPIKMKPGSNWQPWAGMAGGGLAAYMLAKTLMGDDDDGKKGKKGKSFLRSIVPWLAAIAGGVGGHALVSDLSKMVAKGKPAGSAAAKVNEDGTVSLPDPADMPTGKPLYAAAGATLAGSGLLGAKAWNNLRFRAPERLEQQLNDMINDAVRRGVVVASPSGGRTPLINPTRGIHLEEATELRDTVNRGLTRAAELRNLRNSRLNSHRPLEKLRARTGAWLAGARGGHIPRSTWGRSLAGSVALGAATPALAWYGYARNSKLEELRDLISSLQQNGYEAVK